jgi:pimeloyl-ACP methyl ester carboxylesterase
VRVLGIALLLALIGLAAFALLVVTQQRRILYPLRRAPDATALLRAVEGEQVWLERDGVRSEAWLLPARGRSAGPAPLLIFTHGNGELIDDWAREFDEPRTWGVSVLLVEYPGYGRSGGSPSETSIRNAIVAAYDWASARRDVDPRRIVAYGRSLGAAASCALAREREVAALVLESAFTSVPAMAARLGVPRFLCSTGSTTRRPSQPSADRCSWSTVSKTRWCQSRNRAPCTPPRRSPSCW